MNRIPFKPFFALLVFCMAGFIANAQNKKEQIIMQELKIDSLLQAGDSLSRILLSERNRMDSVMNELKKERLDYEKKMIEMEDKLVIETKKAVVLSDNNKLIELSVTNLEKKVADQNQVISLSKAEEERMKTKIDETHQQLSLLKNEYQELKRKFESVLLSQNKKKEQENFKKEEVEEEIIEWHLNPDLSYGTLKDIEGNEYKTIQIGNQVWMAENLSTSKYKNGIKIPEITDDTKWIYAKTGAWCYYDNDENLDMPYGKLYNWYAVSNSNKLCPTGWHVPTNAEWTILTTYLGGEEIAARLLKASNGWDNDGWGVNGNGNNKSGFSGLAGGGRNNTGEFNYFGKYGLWWSSSAQNSLNAWGRGFANESTLVVSNNGEKIFGFSVRCVKD